MTTYETSRPTRTDGRWAMWAALVLGLLFLGLGAPLMAERAPDAGAVQAEMVVDGGSIG